MSITPEIGCKGTAKKRTEQKRRSKWQYFLVGMEKSRTFAPDFRDRGMLTDEYNINKGSRLSVGDGDWYLFIDTGRDFYKRHYFCEKRTMNGVTWWRNIGRLVFIKDVSAYVRRRNPNRIEQRHSKVEIK